MIRRCLILAFTIGVTFIHSGCVTYSDGLGLEVPKISSEDNIIVYSGYDDIVYFSGSEVVSDMDKVSYYVSYDSVNKIPRWVAYDLSANELNGVASRKGKSFKQDTRVKYPQADDSDYRNSGWTRGHLAPAADFKWSNQAMNDTFYYTNCCPQVEYFNGTSWEKLENRVRKWANQFGTVFIVTGTIVGSNLYGKLGVNEITIPDAFYKAILVSDGVSYHSVGFVMNNTADIQPYVNCAVSINYLEDITGEDFFPLLDDEYEEIVEETVDKHFWGL